MSGRLAQRAARIAVLAKAPIPGLAKTRLIPLLGAEGAAGLQAWLLQRTLATALAAELGPVALWCAPDPTHPAFAACVAMGAGRVALHGQPDGDLGERMLAALRTEPESDPDPDTLPDLLIAPPPEPGAAGVLLIGTDCAVLTPVLLRRAATALADADAVVIPAEDGGYVLIGLRRADPEVFRAVSWSSPQVMAQTRQRFAGLGWSVAELPPLWDIDRPSDYLRLCAQFPEVRQCRKP